MNIIELAKEAGLLEDPNCEIYGSYYHLERFATLVAAHEREACAKVCDIWADKFAQAPKNFAGNCAAAIRARGEK